MQSLLWTEGAATLLGNTRVQFRLGVGDALGGSSNEKGAEERRIGHVGEGSNIRTLAQLKGGDNHRQISTL